MGYCQISKDQLRVCLSISKNDSVCPLKPSRHSLLPTAQNKLLIHPNFDLPFGFCHSSFAVCMGWLIYVPGLQMEIIL